METIGTEIEVPTLLNLITVVRWCNKLHRLHPWRFSWSQQKKLLAVLSNLTADSASRVS